MNFHISFSHFFLNRIIYHPVRCPFVQKEKNKIKRLPSLKFRRSKNEIFRPPLLEISSILTRYFRNGIYACDVIFLHAID